MIPRPCWKFTGNYSTTLSFQTFLHYQLPLWHCHFNNRRIVHRFTSGTTWNNNHPSCFAVISFWKEINSCCPISFSWIHMVIANGKLFTPIQGMKISTVSGKTFLNHTLPFPFLGTHKYIHVPTCNLMYQSPCTLKSQASLNLASCSMDESSHKMMNICITKHVASLQS